MFYFIIVFRSGMVLKTLNPNEETLEPSLVSLVSVSPSELSQRTTPVRGERREPRGG